MHAQTPAISGFIFVSSDSKGSGSLSLSHLPTPSSFDSSSKSILSLPWFVPSQLKTDILLKVSWGQWKSSRLLLSSGSGSSTTSSSWKQLVHILGVTAQLLCWSNACDSWLYLVPEGKNTFCKNGLFGNGKRPVLRWGWKNQWDFSLGQELRKLYSML